MGREVTRLGCLRSIGSVARARARWRRRGTVREGGRAAGGGRSAERPERVRVEGVFSRTRPRASGDGGV